MDTEDLIVREQDKNFFIDFWETSVKLGVFRKEIIIVKGGDKKA